MFECAVYIGLNCEIVFDSQFGKGEIERIFGLTKELKIFLQSVAKKQRVLGIFNDWSRQEFDLPVAATWSALIWKRH